MKLRQVKNHVCEEKVFSTFERWMERKNIKYIGFLEVLIGDEKRMNAIWKVVKVHGKNKFAVRWSNEKDMKKNLRTYSLPFLITVWRIKILLFAARKGETNETKEALHITMFTREKSWKQLGQENERRNGSLQGFVFRSYARKNGESDVSESKK